MPENVTYERGTSSYAFSSAEIAELKAIKI